MKAPVKALYSCKIANARSHAPDAPKPQGSPPPSPLMVPSLPSLPESSKEEGPSPFTESSDGEGRPFAAAAAINVTTMARKAQSFALCRVARLLFPSAHEAPPLHRYLSSQCKGSDFRGPRVLVSMYDEVLGVHPQDTHRYSPTHSSKINRLFFLCSVSCQVTREPIQSHTLSLTNAAGRCSMLARRLRRLFYAGARDRHGCCEAVCATGHRSSTASFCADISAAAVPNALESVPHMLTFTKVQATQWRSCSHDA